MCQKESCYLMNNINNIINITNTKKINSLVKKDIYIRDNSSRGNSLFQVLPRLFNDIENKYFFAHAFIALIMFILHYIYKTLMQEIRIVCKIKQVKLVISRWLYVYVQDISHKALQAVFYKILKNRNKILFLYFRIRWICL